eukprot:4472933-Amphidinium_carterae.1
MGGATLLMKRWWYGCSYWSGRTVKALGPCSGTLHCPGPINPSPHAKEDFSMEANSQVASGMGVSSCQSKSERVTGRNVESELTLHWSLQGMSGPQLIMNCFTAS